jgi:integrase
MPAQSVTTHTLMERALVVYRRGKSQVWQCRFKVAGVWQRASTKQYKLSEAKDAARELFYQAVGRQQQNLPVVSRRFSHVAKIVLNQLDTLKKQGKQKVSHDQYVQIIDQYLLPFFKHRLVSNIDYALIDEFNQWRELQMGKIPTRSTLLSHNAAFNLILDEAQRRGYISSLNRPVLSSKLEHSKGSERREAFAAWEVERLLGHFDDWIQAKRPGKNQQLAQLLRDYVEALLDTGARPGKELLNLKWCDITYTDLYIQKLDQLETGHDGSIELGPDGKPIAVTSSSEELYLRVSGKTGERLLFARQATVTALKRLAMRNLGAKALKPFWFKDFLTSMRDSTHKVFVIASGASPTSFQNLFEDYLEHCDLLIEKSTGKKRVFYSLRHTYATQMLERHKTPIHTLAKQMGTSVGMIEKHYSHLVVMNAKDQLRGEGVQGLR